jgi:hypothetical protein
MTALTRRDLSPTEAEQAAADAVLFGYPLVLMGRLRDRAPANAFTHASAPDAGTLASTAWLDLEAEPVVLSVPHCHGQYYVLSLIDMWTSVFASIGPRTTGTGPGRFAITGPHWNGGTLPAGVLPLSAPTSAVKIAGQTQCERPGDTPAGPLPHGFRLSGLRGHTIARGAPAPADLTAHAAEAEAVANLDARSFFGALDRLLELHPPRLADHAVVERLRRFGVLRRPGEQPVDDPALRASHERGLRRGLDSIRQADATPPPEPTGGWCVGHGPSRYGTDYLRRAAAARAGRYITSLADEVPATVSTDAEGRPLTGSHRYQLRFGPDDPPPVRGFWALDSGRSTIGDADGLIAGPDGSLTIYIQPDPPAAREQRSNWLPTPEDVFGLVLRLFWPGIDVLERRWSPPAVTRVG